MGYRSIQREISMRICDGCYTEHPGGASVPVGWAHIVVIPPGEDRFRSAENRFDLCGTCWEKGVSFPAMMEREKNRRLLRSQEER